MFCAGVGTMLGAILISAMAVAIIASLPTWPYSRRWGYYPTSLFGLLLMIAVMLALMDRI